VLGLLALAASSAYLTRHCLAVANTTMQEELHFNNEQFGYLYGAFSLGYLLFQIPGGWLGQKFGTRITMPGLSVIWSLCTVVTAAVTSLGAMLASRLVFGLAQAGLVPNSAKVVKDWFPVAIRGKASSVCAMAMSLGGIITISLTAHLLKDHGWREIFRAYSLVGIVWAIAFYFYFRTRPEQHAGVNQAERDLIREGADKNDDGEPAKMNWGAAFRDRNAWALCGQLIFKAAGYNFFVTFFPAFLEYKYKIAKVDAGMLTTYPLIGVVFGSLLGGVIIDGLYKKTGSKWISRCGVAAGALFLTATFAFGSTFTGSAQELATVIAIGAFFSGVAMPCPWAASIDMGGKNPALVMGMMNAAGCLAGICISPLIGRLIDYIKRTDGNWDIVVFVHAGFYFCAALLWLVVNPNKTIGQPAEAKGDV
jgi:sugar phosphate permease